MSRPKAVVTLGENHEHFGIVHQWVNEDFSTWRVFQLRNLLNDGRHPPHYPPPVARSRSPYRPRQPVRLNEVCREWAVPHVKDLGKAWDQILAEFGCNENSRQALFSFSQLGNEEFEIALDIVSKIILEKKQARLLRQIRLGFYIRAS